MQNIKDTIMAQYANSPVIVTLIESMNEIIDPSKNINDFYNIVWNLNTAVGFGLDILGRIVGISRTVKMTDPNARYLGFQTNPVGTSFDPFDQSPMSAAGANFDSYQLPDSTFRQLIIFKAAANILMATAPNINKFLKLIFNNKAFYLTNGSMRGQYTFAFELTAIQNIIVYSLGLLPEPCGVLVYYYKITTESTFGFSGTELQPFGSGVFA